VKGEVEIKRQETVEGVKCFRCWEGGHYKWECPNIEVERKRRREEKAARVTRPQKAQQEGKLACPNWEKTQEYYGVENVPENTWLLELGWMTGEVIVTYIKCRWCEKKEVYREDNRGQEVLKGKKLEEAEWCGYPKQRRKEKEVVLPTKEKTQQGSMQTETLKDTAEERDKQRDIRRTFKMLKEVWLNIRVEKVNMHEDVMVKALLDSGTTGMFMDKKMAAKHRFRLQKLERPVAVRNIDGTDNSGGAITHQVEVNVYYKSHIERMRIDVYELGKTDIILGMP